MEGKFLSCTFLIPYPLPKYITEEVHKNVENRRDISGKVGEMLEKELKAVDGKDCGTWNLLPSGSVFMDCCPRGCAS